MIYVYVPGFPSPTHIHAPGENLPPPYTRASHTRFIVHEWDADDWEILESGELEILRLDIPPKERAQAKELTPPGEPTVMPPPARRRPAGKRRSRARTQAEADARFHQHTRSGRFIAIHTYASGRWISVGSSKPTKLTFPNANEAG
jgi:hypothetical protein